MTARSSDRFSLRALRAHTGGNVLAIAAASIFPILAIVGGTVDMSRAYMAQAQLQSACDAGVLAGRRASGRSGTYGATEKAKANKMFNANFEPAKLSVTTSNFTSKQETNKNISGVATAVLPTMIMGVFAYDDFDLKVDCTAELQITNTDVMFVLDTTGSMAGAPLEGLKNAVRDFHVSMGSASISPDTRVRYGFVPYSSTVNAKYLIQQNQLPASYFGTSATFTTRESEFNTPRDIVQNGTKTYGAIETYPSNVESSQCDGVGNEWSNDWNNKSTTGTSPNYVTHSYEFVSYAHQSYGKGLEKNISYGICKRRMVSQPFSVKRVYEFTRFLYHETPISTTGLSSFGNVTLGVHGPSAWVSTAGTFDMRELAAMNSTNSSGISTINSSWNGCVMERATVQTANFNPVPAGARDLDVVSAPQNGVADSYWAPNWTGVMFFRNTYGPEYTTAVNNQPSGGFIACPQSMRAFTTADVSSTTVPAWVETYLSGLNAEGATYHDIGMIWGARMASKRGIMAANVNDQPYRSSSRHLIFMTDGALQPNRFVAGNYGIEVFANRVAPQTTSDLDLIPYHSARFRAACDAAKNEDLVIWMVAFGTAITDDMRYCATGDRVYFASDTTQLRAQFRSIASQIANLRLGQ
ncbi:VWA domain-containing protein [Erythrobacter sp. A6_0]|uniref:TadE/TadG family type IV pilus assembly protein n=1 Tax=Erythrobacter sp. A6_0 TaxID=2821089 RepID=UPI001ADAB8C6|nr:VWA domain-containing protein [Erythrobacter sp. A6_0]MBO9510559.1 VWA domain-containing protein [Erythrobacter sp. A6_0]